MSKVADEPVSLNATPRKKFSVGWESLWFVLHLAAVYVLVNFCTPWLGGWIHGKVLPLLEIPPSSSAYGFLFSHLLAFSVIPALLAGLVNARFKHQAAQLVWIVPSAILAYELATFQSSGSVLYSTSSSSAWHYYFAGGFLVPEFHNWHDFWAAAGSNPDMSRGMAQFMFTAPFYSGIAYSTAAWISVRLDLTRKVARQVEQWEHSRFGARHNDTENN